MEINYTRRAVLALSAGTVAGLAGCLGSENAPDLVVRNGMDDDVSFSIEIVRLSDGTSVLSESGTITAGESMTFDDPIRESGRYELRVTADDREERYEWAFSDDESRTVELRIDPDGLSLSEESG